MLGSFFKNLRPSLLGLAFVHMWIYCSTHRFLESGGVSVTAVLYSAMSTALVGIGLAVWRASKTGRASSDLPGDQAAHAVKAYGPATKPCGKPPTLALDMAAATCMALGGVMLSVELPIPPAVECAMGAAVGGIGVAWAYGRWIQVYARLELRFSVPLLFLTMALGSVCKTVIDFLPGFAAAPVFACLPFATFFCVRRAARHLPPAAEPDRYYNARTVGSLSRAVISVAAFSFTIGIIRTAILESTPDPYTFSVLVNHGTEVLLALVFIWWVCVAGRGIDFGRTWRLILILMVTVLVFEPFVAGTGAHAVLFALIRTAHALLVVFFLFLAVADVARHSSYPPLAVYAAGWLAYALPFAAGSFAGTLMAASPMAPIITSIATWALVFVALVLLDDRSLGNQLIFAELNHAEDDSPEMRAIATQRALERTPAPAPATPAGRSEAATRHARCSQLARKHNLTAREAEVLELLVRGHSKTRIAETFLISENTVRGHVKHIYTKLDVHSKQELLDLVEGK